MVYTSFFSQFSVIESFGLNFSFVFPLGNAVCWMWGFAEKPVTAKARGFSGL